MAELTTTVLKTPLQYHLSATAFTEKECNAIMAPCLIAGLPTSGIFSDLRPTKKSRLCTSKFVCSPWHRAYVDRHGVRVQHETPDKTIIEDKFGGAKNEIRGWYSSVRNRLPEVRDAVILDSDSGTVTLASWRQILEEPCLLRCQYSGQRFGSSQSLPFIPSGGDARR
jgi:hypothetical protein